MTTYSLLLLPGDGIGPEVMEQVERLISVLNKRGKVTFKTETDLVGGAAIDKHGTPLTEAAKPTRSKKAPAAKKPAAKTAAKPAAKSKPRAKA